MREAFTKEFWSVLHLLLHYFLVFFIFVVSFEVLPGEYTQKEINKTVKYALHVVSSRWLDTKMSI